MTDGIVTMLLIVLGLFSLSLLPAIIAGLIRILPFILAIVAAYYIIIHVL